MALTKKSKKSTIIKHWVAALRSGEYRQGAGRLKATVQGEGQYCCLGVLADLAVKAKVIKTFKGHAAFPSKKVIKWAGLNSVDGSYADRSLANENDGGNSFKQIARIIESKPDGLFV
jgi:hypothetical protein